MYPTAQKLLQGTEFEMLILNQQMAPQYFSIWGEAGHFNLNN